MSDPGVEKVESATTSAGPGAGSFRRGLRAGSIGAVAAGVMAAAHEAPSVSMFFNSPFAAANAGKAMAAAFLLASIIIALVAWVISLFSAKLPTSGYAYTFVSRSLGPRAGFVSAWMTILVFVGTPLIVPPAFGVTFSDLVQRLTGVRIHWAIFTALLLAFVAVLVIRGIRESLEAGAVFLFFEVLVIGAFAVYLLFKAEGPQAPSALSPTAAPSLGAFAIALIFGILSFQGFEAAATLGEETREARRRLPLALMTAVVLTGVFYTFVSYAVTVAWGPDKMQGYADAGTPFPILAEDYAGSWLAILFDGVVCAGLVAVTIAAVNAGARVLFAMARERLLPAAFARTHPHRQTPHVASAAVVVLGGLGGIIFGLAWDPLQVWGFIGSVIALSAILVYILVCVSLIPFMRREYPAEFSWGQHLALPLVATGLLLIPLLIKNGLLWPPPDYPFNLPPYITLGWAVIGVAMVVYLGRTRPRALEQAGQLIAE
jgi:amino acid transporter